MSFKPSRRKLPSAAAALRTAYANALGQVQGLLTPRPSLITPLLAARKAYLDALPPLLPKAAVAKEAYLLGDLNRYALLAPLLPASKQAEIEAKPLAYLRFEPALPYAFLAYAGRKNPEAVVDLLYKQNLVQVLLQTNNAKALAKTLDQWPVPLDTTSDSHHLLFLLREPLSQPLATVLAVHLAPRIHSPALLALLQETRPANLSATGVLLGLWLGAIEPARVANHFCISAHQTAALLGLSLDAILTEPTQTLRF